MGERGVYAIDRGVFEHPFFKAEPFTEREAWMWMIGEAAWRPTRVRINRAMFDVKRGELVHAARFLARRWQWSEARVRRFLERLKLERMIDALASSEATRITICNYDDYQYGRRAGDEPTDEPATSSRRRKKEGEESKNLGRGDTRARDPFSISPEAFSFANELAKLCGQNLDFLTPEWMNGQPAMRAQLWLNSGWQIPIMREAATAAVRKKRDGPPQSVRYFEKIFVRAHAPPLPLPSVQLVKTDGGQGAENRSGSWNGGQQNRGGFATYAVECARAAADQGPSGT